MTLLIFLTPLLYAPLSIALFSSPSPPFCLFLCHSLLTQVHLQLHTPSCLLPSLQPSARCYWIPFSNCENKSDKNWRPFLFITIYHNTALWLNLLPLFDLLKMCLHNVEGKVIKWHCTSIQLKSLVQSISFFLPAADMDAFLSERNKLSAETHIWNAGYIRCCCGLLNHLQPRMKMMWQSCAVIWKYCTPLANQEQVKQCFDIINRTLKKNKKNKNKT